MLQVLQLHYRAHGTIAHQYLINYKFQYTAHRSIENNMLIFLNCSTGETWNTSKYLHKLGFSNKLFRKIKLYIKSKNKLFCKASLPSKIDFNQQFCNKRAQNERKRDIRNLPKPQIYNTRILVVLVTFSMFGTGHTRLLRSKH